MRRKAARAECLQRAKKRHRGHKRRISRAYRECVRVRNVGRR